MTGPVQKTRVVASCQAYDSRHAIQHLAKKSCEETLMKIIMNNSENEMMSIKLRTSMYCTIMSCQTWRFNGHDASQKANAKTYSNHTCPEVPAAELEIVLPQPNQPLDHNFTLPKTEGFFPHVLSRPPTSLGFPACEDAWPRKHLVPGRDGKLWFMAGMVFLLPFLETNIALENGWLEDYFPVGKANFSSAMLVSGRVTMLQWGRLLILIPLTNSHVQTSIGLEVMIDAINHEKHYKTIMNLSNIYKQFLWTKGILKFSLGALMVCCCCCCCQLLNSFSPWNFILRRACP